MFKCLDIARFLLYSLLVRVLGQIEGESRKGFESGEMKLILTDTGSAYSTIL
jgi:hypothetical protein